MDKQILTTLNAKERLELDRCLTMKKEGTIYRQAKLFNTEYNNYMYDLGTGKVIVLDDNSYLFLSDLLSKQNNMSYESLINNTTLYSLSYVRELMDVFIKENLLKAPEFEHLYHPKHYELLEEEVNNNLQQLILELTGKCNLRCGYCIYNDNCKDNRNFISNDMSFEVAKAAIDHAKKHAGNRIAITFYGGEPLLKMDLMKWCIEYSLENLSDKDLTFSLTTNLTLMNKEIAEYLASIPKLSVVCSVDGPEKIHNSYRKYIDGRGSFKDALHGLKCLAKAFEKSSNIILFNTVFAPPYSIQKLDEIEQFFNSLDWLPNGTTLTVTYPNYESVQDEYKEFDKIRLNPKYVPAKLNSLNPMWLWKKKQIISCEDLDDKSKKIFVNDKTKLLLDVHKRFISDKPYPIFPFLSCCVPGSRRLYVNVDGKFFVCERVGNSPDIGNVFDGLNIEKIRKYYVDNFAEKFEACKNCWAVRICHMCYANCYNSSGVDITKMHMMCETFKKETEQKLVLYHYIYEISPQKLDCLNTYTII